MLKRQKKSRKWLPLHLSDIKRQLRALDALLVHCRYKKLQITFSFTTMKLSVRLDKRYQLANGKYPVKLVLARNGKTMYVPLNIDVRAEDWNQKAKNMEYVRNIPNRRALNIHIRAALANAEQKIRDLQLRGKLREYDDKRLLKLLSYDPTEHEQSRLLKYHADKFIAERRTDGTREAYETSMKAFARHYDYEHFLLQDFDKNLILDYIKKLEAEGLKRNTIEHYLSHLRIIYKFAYVNDAIDKPFPYIMSTKQRTTKRNLFVEQIRQLRQGEGLTDRQKRYVDIFMLILYMRGINMKDLSELTDESLHNGRISYDRDKTGKPYEVKVEPEMMEIIEKYRGRKHLLKFFDGEKPSYYKNFGNCMRQTLRTAAMRLGMTEKISAYWARHSWATLAIEIGGTMEMVSAGLGHSLGVPVTNIYVAFRQKQIDELARKVIDYILQKGEFAE